MNFLARPGGAAMKSRLRTWLFNPKKTLRGVDIRPGQTVLEVGCGTGFFTIPAAGMIGEHGKLIAMEPLSDYVEVVKRRVRDAGLKNVEILRRDALDTRLETASVDVVLLFGVVPFPTLPLKILLPEMHRVLRVDGILAVWLFPTSAGVPASILRSGFFAAAGRKNGVYNYRRVQRPARHTPETGQAV